MRFWAIVHNAVAHPLMVVLPRQWGDALHDWTADRAFRCWACEVESAGSGGSGHGYEHTCGS